MTEIDRPETIYDRVRELGMDGDWNEEQWNLVNEVARLSLQNEQQQQIIDDLQKRVDELVTLPRSVWIQ